MKKVLVYILLFGMLSLTACGDGESFTNDNPAPASNATVFHDDEQPDEKQNESERKNDSDTVGWRQFLNDYEAWIDRYVELVKKQKENPSDISVLSDYAGMAAELNEWTQQADEMRSELETVSPQELLEYTTELARIVSKMTEAMNP